MYLLLKHGDFPLSSWVFRGEKERFCPWNFTPFNLWGVDSAYPEAKAQDLICAEADGRGLCSACIPHVAWPHLKGDWWLLVVRVEKVGKNTQT